MTSAPARVPRRRDRRGLVRARRAARSTSPSRRSRSRSARWRPRSAAPLVERLPRGVRPTPAGEALLPAARAALAAAGRARRSARMVLGLEAGELEIATVGTVALGLLPPVLRRWRARHPGAHRAPARAPRRARARRGGRRRRPPTSASARGRPSGPDRSSRSAAEELVVVLPPGDPLRDARRRRSRWPRSPTATGSCSSATTRSRSSPRRYAPPRASRRGRPCGRLRSPAAPALAAAGLGPALVPVNIVAGPAAPVRRAASTRRARASCAPSRAPSGRRWRARSWICMTA